jgi:hypothetical protein
VESVFEADLQRHTEAARGDLARALRRLKELGIVTRNCGHGWRFTPGLTTTEERAAAYRFRIVMEPATLLEPGYALPEGFPAEMRAGYGVFLDGAWHNSHAIAFFELNAAFHGIVAASGNRFFIQATEQHNRLRRLMNYDWHLGQARVHQNARASGDRRCAGSEGPAGRLSGAGVASARRRGTRRQAGPAARRRAQTSPTPGDARMTAESRPNALTESFWMPFTAARGFREHPMLFVGAEGMHYIEAGGRRVLDGMAGLWCVNAGHAHPKIVEAIWAAAG